MLTNVIAAESPLVRADKSSRSKQTVAGLRNQLSGLKRLAATPGATPPEWLALGSQYQDSAAVGTVPTIAVNSVAYPTTGSGVAHLTVSGTGFTPGGEVWVGANPLTDQLTHCGGPGQGGWCALRVNAGSDGAFRTVIDVANVSAGCPPALRVDATDIVSDIGSNEVTASPGFCIT